MEKSHIAIRVSASIWILNSWKYTPSSILRRKTKLQSSEIQKKRASSSIGRDNSIEQMRPGQDPGFDTARGRYLPRTLRTAPRDPIPQKQRFDPQWAIQCQDQAAPLWNLKTPSGLNFSLVSASFQGAVRQGTGRVLESLQWALREPPLL